MSKTLVRFLVALAVALSLPLQGMAEAGVDPCEASAHHEVACEPGGCSASISSAWLTPAPVAPQAEAEPASVLALAEHRSVRLDRPPLAL